MRTLNIIYALALILVLVACEGKSTTTDDSAAPGDENNAVTSTDVTDSGDCEDCPECDGPPLADCDVDRDAGDWNCLVETFTIDWSMLCAPEGYETYDESCRGLANGLVNWDSLVNSGHATYEAPRGLIGCTAQNDCRGIEFWLEGGPDELVFMDCAQAESCHSAELFTAARLTVLIAGGTDATHGMALYNTGYTSYEQTLVVLHNDEWLRSGGLETLDIASRSWGGNVHLVNLGVSDLSVQEVVNELWWLGFTELLNLE